MRAYLSRLHPVLLVVLALLTVGFGVVGWWLRPASNGFPTVPANMSLLIGTAGWDSFTETLTHTSGSGAVLTLNGMSPDATSGAGVTNKHWELWVDHLGPARLCTPAAVFSDNGAASEVAVPHQQLGPPDVAHPFVSDTPGLTGSAVTGVYGSGPFYVRLCWSSGAPVALNGAYLSAVLPPVQAYGTGQAGLPVTRKLNLGALDASDYAVQSLVQPTSVTPGGWQWTGALPGSSPLTFSAVDTTQTQHDSYQAFLSGILFGIAGGAFVSLVVELVSPFRSRADRGAVGPAPA